MAINDRRGAEGSGLFVAPRTTADDAGGEAKRGGKENSDEEKHDARLQAGYLFIRRSGGTRTKELSPHPASITNLLLDVGLKRRNWS